MIIKEFFSKSKDKLHFFRIQGVFQDQGHFQGLFKVYANPGENDLNAKTQQKSVNREKWVKSQN